MGKSGNGEIGKWIGLTPLKLNSIVGESKGIKPPKIENTTGSRIVRGQGTFYFTGMLVNKTSRLKTNRPFDCVAKGEIQILRRQEKRVELKISKYRNVVGGFVIQTRSR
jgi:hypothetical protein